MSVPGLNILSGSVLGIVVVLALLGYIWFKPSVDELKARCSKAEQQRDELIGVYEDQVIPVLAEVKDKVVPLLTEIKAELQADRRRR